MKSGLGRLNALPRAEAAGELGRCCGSTAWVEGMLGRRPFADPQSLYSAAEDVWRRLASPDRLEAFSCHPEIGDLESLQARFSSTREWSQGEQSGVAGTSDETLRELARANRLYREKFGYIFIVCASGKSAAEVLEILQRRLENSPDEEIETAAREQGKITRIRLQKMLDEGREGSLGERQD